MGKGVLRPHYHRSACLFLDNHTTENSGVFWTTCTAIRMKDRGPQKGVWVTSMSVNKQHAHVWTKQVANEASNGRPPHLHTENHRIIICCRVVNAGLRDRCPLPSMQCIMCISGNPSEGKMICRHVILTINPLTVVWTDASCYFLQHKQQERYRQRAVACSSFQWKWIKED